MQSVSIFLDQDMFLVNIRQAVVYYSFTGIPRLEPKHETDTHTLRSCQPASLPSGSIGSHLYV
jgi:hypothetical protein